MMKNFIIYRTYFIAAFIATIPATLLRAQDDELPQETQSAILDAIEFLSENSDYEVDYEELYDKLRFLAEKPLDLNEADFDSLNELGFLSLAQIESLINYRIKVGKLVNIYEIQAVPDWDLSTIARVLPFISVEGRIDDFQATPLELFFGGKYYWFTRFQRVLEDQAGYLEKIQSDSTYRANYTGAPWRIYSRFRYTNGNKVSYGITAEKDAGEVLFGSYQPKGFDFYSAHLFIRDIGIFKNIILGDFQANVGQGLILWTGIAFGKSAEAISIKRNAIALRPYTSINEYAFLRGGGITLAKGHWESTLFGSYRKMDATITPLDSLGNPIDLSDYDEEEPIEEADINSYQTSLPMDGYHRTLTELDKKHKLGAYTAGGNVRYRQRNFNIGINAIYNHFMLPINKAQFSYNQFQFNGNNLINTSVDYNFLIKNIHLFGETAVSGNGGWATLNGIMKSLHPTLDISILYRHYQKEFQTFSGAPFGENLIPQNEEGLYTGVVFTPIKKWKIAGYADLFRFPWLKFTTDSPSIGADQLVQVTYKPSRNIEIYGRIRNRNKEQNLSASSDNIDQVVDRNQVNYRIQLMAKISKVLILRNRVEWVRLKEGNRPLEIGFMIYQDIQYKPLGKPYSLSGRIALFDTDGYNTRIYAFENDLLFSFNIPAYQNQGIRYFIMGRYKFGHWGDLSVRFAQTNYRDLKTIGTGNEAINDHHKSEIKVQWMFKW